MTTTINLTAEQRSQVRREVNRIERQILDEHEAMFQLFAQKFFIYLAWYTLAVISITMTLTDLALQIGVS